MLNVRVMPCLLLQNSRLVKTIQFKNPNYVGDPVNAVKIYNEKEVDELIVLDTTATLEKRKPPFEMIAEITNECFMPLTYGGGVNDVGDIKKLLSLGVEKVAINTHAIENPSFVTKASEIAGSQAIIVSIDAKKTAEGKYEVFTHGGRNSTGLEPVALAKKMEKLGAGEVLLTSIDKEGTMEGYDVDLIRSVSRAIGIPLIACGGAGKVEHFKDAIDAGAAAVAAGSMAVYIGTSRAVLISFPSPKELKKVLGGDRRW